MSSLQSTTRSTVRATHGALLFVFLGLFLFGGCNKSASPPRLELVVLAAASLKESFTEIASDYEKTHSGVKVTLSFAGSQQLAQSIKAGAPADVFASADKKQMDEVATSGRIGKSVVAFATNDLVIIANPKSAVRNYLDLTKPGVKVVLANNQVPAGKYSLQVLARAGSREAVLKNVVSYEENVRSVSAKVELGEADAGIVYRTDALVSGDKVRVIQLDSKVNQVASYFIAPIAGGDVGLAYSFIDWVFGPPGQNVLKKRGFLPLAVRADANRETLTSKVRGSRFARAGLWSKASSIGRAYSQGPGVELMQADLLWN